MSKPDVRKALLIATAGVSLLAAGTAMAADNGGSWSHSSGQKGQGTHPYATQSQSTTTGAGHMHRRSMQQAKSSSQWRKQLKKEERQQRQQQHQYGGSGQSHQ